MNSSFHFLFLFSTMCLNPYFRFGLLNAVNVKLTAILLKVHGPSVACYSLIHRYSTGKKGQVWGSYVVDRVGKGVSSFSSPSLTERFNCFINSSLSRSHFIQHFSYLNGTQVLSFWFRPFMIWHWPAAYEFPENRAMESCKI